jgi:putative holliday junction resolvase
MIQNYLAFDFGLRRIGVASGQTLTGTAEPLATVETHQNEPDWRSIAQLVQTWRPHALVVGIPYHIDGSENSLTDAARHFAQQLGERFALPVHLMDERLSSRAAEQLYADQRAAGRKRNKASIDALAAKLILESWLAEQRKR